MLECHKNRVSSLLKFSGNYSYQLILCLDVYIKSDARDKYNFVKDWVLCEVRTE